MTPGRFSRFAALALVAASLAAPPARAGDDSEAEKLAAEEAEAEKKAVQVRDEAMKAFEAVRPKLENLGAWCTGFDLQLERSRIADVLLAFDPDNAKARDWLGFKRQKDGTWKPGPWRAYTDNRPESLAEFAKKRAEIADALRAQFLPLFERAGDWTQAGLRERMFRSLIDLCPDDEDLRALHGEVRVKDKWLLRESAETPANRERLAAAVVLSRTEAGKTPRSEAASAAKGWGTSLASDGIVVHSDVPPADTTAILDSCLAARRLFASALQVDALFHENLRLYLLPDTEANANFLEGIADLTPQKRRSLAPLGSYWLNGHECVVAHDKQVERRDSAVRQILADLRGDFQMLSDAPPWLGEGVGTYLTYRLLGTRETAFIDSGNYSDESISRDVAAVDADWVVVARKLVDKGFALNVPVLTGLPLNSMTKDDGLMAYALAAYFIEGRPKDLAALLKALGHEGTKFHRALAESCSVDVEGLQIRFVRWLHEIPAK